MRQIIQFLNFAVLCLFALSVPLTSRAEGPEGPTESSYQNFGVASAEEIRIQLFKQSAKRILKQKLSTPEGGSAKIVILKPINYTDLKTVEPIVSTIVS